MTQWSLQQEAALDVGRRWLDAPAGSVPQVFRLWGYAGVGKSSIAKEFNAHVGGRALAGSFTGRAASVMQKKGLPQATTIHRMIYQPTGDDGHHLKNLQDELATLSAVKEPTPTTEARKAALRRAIEETKEAAKQPKFILKEAEEVRRAPLVIIDEASMISERVAEDLLSFGTKLLVLGDPAQLPPVRGVPYFMGCEPDVLLTEVHRQAQESAILRLATLAREGKNLPRGDLGDAQVVTSIGASSALAADQVLCGTNARRRAINARHRQLEGRKSPMPEAGEKIIALKNDHASGVMNGSMWVVTQDAEWEPGDATVYLRIRPEDGGDEMGVPAESCMFLDDEARPQWSDAQWFTWGAAATVYKFQGGQAPNVVFFSAWPRRESLRAHTYTGITRASEFLTVVED
jgi:exodeoxyribonuclease-5